MQTTSSEGFVVVGIYPYLVDSCWHRMIFDKANCVISIALNESWLMQNPNARERVDDTSLHLKVAYK